MSDNTDTAPIAVVVAGAAGRMGSTVLRNAITDDDFKLAGALEHHNSDRLGAPVSDYVDGYAGDVTYQEKPETVSDRAAVLIDFTRPEATRKFLDVAIDGDIKMVIGTTGFEQRDTRKIEQASESTSIVQAPNMSVGINLLLELVDETTRCLGDDFDVEVTEMHHRYKEDSPSGTANLLAEQVAKARNQNLEKVKKIGREGFEGERSSEEIGISSLRGGDVVGDHTIMFAGDGERIELTHRASSRDTFARGALRAAKFLRNHDRGLFSMKDVLGL